MYYTNLRENKYLIPFTDTFSVPVTKKIIPATIDTFSKPVTKKIIPDTIDYTIHQGNELATM